MVVVDLGARYKGYYSDMTITIPIGKLNKDGLKQKNSAQILILY